MNRQLIRVNTYSEVYESCSECGRNLYRTRDIWVDIDSDKYVCKHCKDTYNINAVRCVEMD